MINWILPSLGLIGGIIIAAGYFPQFFRLLKVKDSTGISISAWLIFLVGDLMLLIYSISIDDFVFITLEVLFSLLILLIIILTYIYRRK